jgi:hypothetical protein
MFYYCCTCSCKSKLVVYTPSKCIAITRWNVGLINCLYMSFILITFFICQILLHMQIFSMHWIAHFKFITTTQHIWSGNVCAISQLNLNPTTHQKIIHSQQFVECDPSQFYPPHINYYTPSIALSNVFDAIMHMNQLHLPLSFDQ